MTAQLCACGCGTPTPISKYTRTALGHITNGRGEIPKSVDLAHVIAITRHFRPRWWFLWLR